MQRFEQTAYGPQSEIKMKTLRFNQATPIHILAAAISLNATLPSKAQLESRVYPPDIPNATSLTVEAASASPEYVTGTVFTEDPSSPGIRTHLPYRWSKTTGYELIPTLNGRLQLSTDISADGTAISGSGLNAEGTASIGWVYRDGIGTQELVDTLNARCISGDGTTIGGSGVFRDSLPGNAAYLDSAQFGRERLIFTPARGSTTWDVSHDGSVAAGVVSRTDGKLVPFVWSRSRGATIIDPAPLGFSYGRAQRVSADGNFVAGLFFDANAEPHGFLWTPSAGVEVLGPLPATLISDFTRHISADGREIWWLRSRWTRAKGLETTTDIRARFGIPVFFDAEAVADDGLRVFGRFSYRTTSGTQVPAILVTAPGPCSDGWQGTTGPDCDRNGADDICELSQPADVLARIDSDGNGVIDDCENRNPCPADVNKDGALNELDFHAWLAAFLLPHVSADQNGDHQVNGLDFGAWLNNYNAGCE